ncbi:MAG: acyl-CoA dehydrogenase C-terminal domain-containing protein, partial [Hyphomicrobiales bacterium]|nr:acyl-CoA dehydrogenase C-terminal domain-containing protein [Hyphomicrobiales bacterium]
ASKPVPIIAHADVRRMLLAQKAYAEGGVALCLYAARLVDDEKTAPTDAERMRAKLLLDILTPIVKSWPSQWCLEANSLAIQVHGGYGYTREYPVERIYRDNRLNPIHEGTHGIQAMDLLGRKVPMARGAAVEALFGEIAATAAAARDAGLGDHGAALDAALDDLRGTTSTLTSVAGQDATLFLANATPYLEAMGHLVVGWIWLRMALVAAAAPPAEGPGMGGDADFYAGKRAACDYYFRWEMPRIAAWTGVLKALDRTCLDMQDAWF